MINFATCEKSRKNEFCLKKLTIYPPLKLPVNYYRLTFLLFSSHTEFTQKTYLDRKWISFSHEIASISQTLPSVPAHPYSVQLVKLYLDHSDSLEIFYPIKKLSWTKLPALKNRTWLFPIAPSIFATKTIFNI